VLALFVSDISSSFQGGLKAAPSNETEDDADEKADLRRMTDPPMGVVPFSRN
jgi:hypothetical protein